MDVKSIYLATSVIAVGVEALAIFYMWRSKAYKTYPALMLYLALDLLFSITFGVLPWGPHSVSGVVRYRWYFWGYWTEYFVCAVLLVFMIQRLFREVMAPLPGLSRLGVLAFRWVITVSIIVSVGTSYGPLTTSKFPLLAIGNQFMRCVSILELCLLAFVTLVVHRVGLSYRSRPFGVALGFGMIACMEFLTSALNGNNHATFSPMGIALEVSGILALGVWAFYFARPEPARNPVTLPLSSSLLRWNEISLALGQSGAQVAVTPSHEFFLSDVEKVVDRVLIKNSLKATRP